MRVKMKETIREAAARVDFEIKGRLRLWKYINKEPVFLDDDNNEYTLCLHEPGAGYVMIVDKDGALWT